ncbi:hypothetical protein GW17_00044572 [Ensete ventricosum]|nr:hypothetical protein GW17_00044572 [Ensete ventricosum]RZS26933.1 hypothetical protein BHM03_00060349 [Ensete ventricosum]
MKGFGGGKEPRFELERRVVASYKKFEVFRYGLQRFSQVTYKFRYKITTGLFKSRYRGLKVDEDPYVELSSDVEVFANMEVPFDDRPTSPSALPPLA